MTHTLRVATPEQYSYIEFQFEGSAEEAIAEYHRLTKLTTGGTGLDTRDFNKVLDQYLWGSGTMTADEYAVMNIEQQTIIQTIKRSKARNKN